MLIENNYTKGEWELRGNKIFVNGTYKTVAIVTIQNSWDKDLKPIVDVEAIANAKLLCSAPKLLEALNELTETLTFELPLGSDEKLYPIFQAHQKALLAIKEAIT